MPGLVKYRRIVGNVVPSDGKNSLENPGGEKKIGFIDTIKLTLTMWLTFYPYLIKIILILYVQQTTILLAFQWRKNIWWARYRYVASVSGEQSSNFSFVIMLIGN